MRHCSAGFSPLEKADSKSSRLSIRREGLSSVRVVMRGGVSCGPARTPALPIYGSTSSAPVTDRGHPGRERGQGGGFGAQNAGAQRDWDGVGRGANGSALLVGKPALGPDQDDRGAGLKGVRRMLASSFIGEIERPRGVALIKEPYERQRFGDAGKQSPPALLGGFDCNGFETLELYPLGNGSLGHHRDQSRGAEFGSLFNQPVSLRALDRSEREPDVGDSFRLAGPALDAEGHALL